MLGPGAFQRDPDGFVGSLGFQARVAVPGGTGRFDDLLGPRRWALLTRGGAPRDHLDAAQLRVLSGLDAIAREVLPAGSTPRDGAIVDVDGRYEAWMDEHGVQAVLTRPDFAVFGAAQRLADLGDLIDSLAHELNGGSRCLTQRCLQTGCASPRRRAGWATGCGSQTSTPTSSRRSGSTGRSTSSPRFPAARRGSARCPTAGC